MNRLDKREEKIIRLGSYMISENKYDKVMQSVRCLNLLAELRLIEAKLSFEQRNELMKQRANFLKSNRN